MEKTEIKRELFSLFAVDICRNIVVRLQSQLCCFEGQDVLVFGMVAVYHIEQQRSQFNNRHFTE